jgi:DNA-binding beta-propeller fold protein YncE
MGTTGQKHSLTTPGDFAMPGGMAVDKEGNLYVADTMNNRIEVFDADGKFISAYGKNGDGPGDFARPKGVAIDSDGHIWVADGALNRVQVFDREWRLLTYMGGNGNLPGQFAGLNAIAIDKLNRVFTSEMYPGRVQIFRYVTETEAASEKASRQTELDKKASR